MQCPEWLLGPCGGWRLHWPVRLGYTIVPDRLADAFASAKQLADRHAPSRAQRPPQDESRALATYGVQGSGRQTRAGSHLA